MLGIAFFSWRLCRKTLSARSGGPITAFGVRWPNDNRSAGGPREGSGGGSGWLCVANCSSIDRELVYTERGAFGRMPWVTNLGANVTWTLPVEGVQFHPESILSEHGHQIFKNFLEIYA